MSSVKNQWQTLHLYVLAEIEIDKLLHKLLCRNKVMGAGYWIAETAAISWENTTTAGSMLTAADTTDCTLMQMAVAEPAGTTCMQLLLRSAEPACQGDCTCHRDCCWMRLFRTYRGMLQGGSYTTVMSQVTSLAVTFERNPQAERPLALFASLCKSSFKPHEVQ